MSICGRDEEREEQERISQMIDDDLHKQRPLYKSTIRLLVLGAGESGKSTIVKQMKIIHKDGFSDEERYDKGFIIKSNIKDILVAVVRVMPELNPPVELVSPENCEIATYIRNVVAKPAFSDFSPEFFRIVEKFWKDECVQAAYKRSNDYQMLDSSYYFMAPEKLQEVASPNYKPCDKDILHCREITRNVTGTLFVVDKVKFQMFDVGGQRSERGKWIKCFNDISAIIYVASSSSFDRVIREDGITNRLQESLDLFESLWNNRWLGTVSMVLFLNKQDLLKKKILEGKKLEHYFPDFASYDGPEKSGTIRDPDEDPAYTNAKYFIKNMFVNISLANNTGRHYCYPHFTTAVDTENIRRVFDTCKSNIQRLHLEQYDLL